MNFEQIINSLIHYRTVCRIVAFKETLLKGENPTFDKCLELCRTAELSHENRMQAGGRTVKKVHMKKGTAGRASKTVIANYYHYSHYFLLNISKKTKRSDGILKTMQKLLERKLLCCQMTKT